MPLGRKCPKLRTKGHAAAWFFRYAHPAARARSAASQRSGHSRPSRQPRRSSPRRSPDSAAAPRCRTGRCSPSPPTWTLYIAGKKSTSSRGRRLTTQEIVEPLLEACAWPPAAGRPARLTTSPRRPGDDADQPARSPMASGHRRCCGGCSTPALMMSATPCPRREAAEEVDQAAVPGADRPRVRGYPGSDERGGAQQIMVNPCDGVELPRASEG